MTFIKDIASNESDHIRGRQLVMPWEGTVRCFDWMPSDSNQRSTAFVDDEKNVECQNTFDWNGDVRIRTTLPFTEKWLFTKSSSPCLFFSWLPQPIICLRFILSSASSSLTPPNFMASFTTSTNLWWFLLDLQPQHPSTRMVTVPMLHMSEPSQSGPLTSKTPQLPSLADGWTQSLSKFGVDSHSLVFLCLYRRWRKPRWQRLKSTRLASTTGRLRRGLPYCTS